MTPVPRVTVVIPHHNGGPFLADALRSVDQQRWRDWEIVIVDDGSADEHRRTARGFASDRVRVLEQANKGPAAATQAGIDVARGEYIAFLDQDDLWHPHKLERDVRLLDMHPSVDITFCGYQMIDERGRTLAPPHVPHAERFDASDLLEDFCIGPTATVTVRTTAARQAGRIDTSLRRFYDFEYFVRIASRRPASVAASRESLAWYRRHPGQLSANVSQMRLEWQDAFGAMVSRYNIDDRAVRIAQSNMHRYFAFLEYEQGRFGAASRRMVEAFCFAPARFVTERRNWRAASGAVTALMLPSSVRQTVRVEAGEAAESEPTDSCRTAPETLGSMLHAEAVRCPESPAIVAPLRRPLSYHRLWQQVEGIVAWLNAAGVGRADRVAIVLPNGPEMAVAFLGVSAGAAAAPLNPGYGARDLDFYLADLRAKAVIVQRGVDSPAIAIAKARGITIFELAPIADAEAGLFALNGDRLIDLAGGHYSQSSDVALVLHTSGTTSRPKIVPLTQGNLFASAQNVATSLSLSSVDRCLNVMPLFHIHGLVAGTLASLSAGGSVICTAGFDEDSFFGWLRDLRPSWYTAVPTIHQAVVRSAPQAVEIIGGHRLRFVRSSSAALAPSISADLEAIFGAPVIDAYGMTEAAHQIASTPLPPGTRVPGSVGLATGCEVAIMDEQGTLLGPGQAGEVVIRGRNVTLGYDHNPDANAVAFREGWLRTGDQGMLDGHGYLSLTGRLKEIINRGGEKVAPREIDEVLLQHADVREAAAFGMPHPTLGETVAAAVVPREGKTLSEGQIRDFAITHLPDFKVPTRIVIVTEIPKGPTGKLQRIGLADRLAAQLAVVYERPGDDLERLSATIFEQILQVDRVGRHDNFFALGGDSLRAMQVSTRLTNALGLELPPTTLFHHPTPAALAIELASRQHDQDVASLAAELQELPEGEVARMLRKASGSDA